MKLVLLNEDCGVHDVKECDGIPGEFIVRSWDQLTLHEPTKESFLTISIDVDNSMKSLALGFLSNDSPGQFNVLCVIVAGNPIDVDNIVKKVINTLKNMFKDVRCVMRGVLE